MQIARKYPYVKLRSTKGGERVIRKGDAILSVLEKPNKTYYSEGNWSNLENADVKSISYWANFCEENGMYECSICVIK